MSYKETNKYIGAIDTALDLLQEVNFCDPLPTPEEIQSVQRNLILADRISIVRVEDDIKDDPFIRTNLTNTVQDFANRVHRIVRLYEPINQKPFYNAKRIEELLRANGESEQFIAFYIRQLAILQGYCAERVADLANLVERLKSDCVPNCKPVKETNDIQDVLNIDEAKTYLDRLVKAGFCMDGYRWNNTKSLYQAAQAAHHISFILWGENRWKPFERLWGVSKMAQTYNKLSVEANQDSITDVDNLFPENKPKQVEKFR